MGLNRSGSSAIHEFFDCHNIHTAHYCCHNSQRTQFPCDTLTCGACVYSILNHSRPAFQGCGNYQVYAQWDVETSNPFAWFLPQHYTLPLIHEQYPQSTWILNARETPEQWADSVLHWYSITQRMLQSFGYQYDESVPQPTVGLEKDVTDKDLYQALEVSIQRANDK